MDGGHRQSAARVLAPLAFLAAVTLAVVIARPVFDDGDARPAAVQTTESAPTATAPATTDAQTAPTTTTATTQTAPADATFHVVESGDTLAAIADEYGTTVEALVELNPGIDPVALTIGQRVRVG